MTDQKRPFHTRIPRGGAEDAKGKKKKRSSHRGHKGTEECI